MANNSWNSIAGNARNGQASFVSTWITDNYEYVILVRHDWHPIVCQRTVNPKGGWITHDVHNSAIGLIDVTDSHMGVSIAVDQHGHIHVSGNTHDTKIRHIRSVLPHDITNWAEAPLIERQARHVTNLADNGVVEVNLDGWSSEDVALYTLDRVTHAYGWGSSSGNDTNCMSARLTRTSSSPSPYIGKGEIVSINNNGFPATGGQRYNASLSFRNNMITPAPVDHQLRMYFRDGSNSIISYVDSAIQNATDPTKWYRCYIQEAMAPAGTTNILIAYSSQLVSGNATTGDELWVDGLMLYEGEAAGDIVYRDGSFNEGEDKTGWEWNGVPYASTSTGPIRSNGYAGINTSTYNRFQSFSDGTLVLSFAQLTYPKDPVGRAWSIWKMGTTGFEPLVNQDGCLMRTVMKTVQQGSDFPILSTGNPTNDNDIADRSYASGLWIDKNDTIHVFSWFRVKTNTSYGSLLYLQSKDKGASWQNIQGQPLAIPLTYPDSLTNTLVSVDGVTPIPCSTLGGVCESNGNPAVVVNEALGGGRMLIYWNGSAWIKENISSYAFIDNPTPQFIRDDLWLFGAKTVAGKGSQALWGINHTKGTGPIVRLGEVGIGTPDGNYTYESGATYEGAPTHAGGLDISGNYIFRRMIPDNDNPVIRQFGGGPRGEVV